MRCRECSHCIKSRCEAKTFTDTRPVRTNIFSKAKEETFTTVTHEYIPPFCTRYPKWVQVEPEHYCGEYKEQQ